MADTSRRSPLAPNTTGRDDSQLMDQQAAETKMRRALGLGTGGGHHTPQQRPEQARARHRFVQDGGVPVVMLNQKVEPETALLRERITALESTLDNERQAHGSTLRHLKELEGQHTALQTRLAHAELTHRDALEQERRLRVTAQEALQEALAAAPAPRRRAVPAASPPPAPAAAAAIEQESRSEPAQPPKPELPKSELPKRGRGRPRSTAVPDPKPVRWWTPSFRAKGKS